jgi:hypothetical protein
MFEVALVPWPRLCGGASSPRSRSLTLRVERFVESTVTAADQPELF